jgi:hypothetical protein
LTLRARAEILLGREESWDKSSNIPDGGLVSLEDATLRENHAEPCQGEEHELEKFYRYKLGLGGVMGSMSCPSESSTSANLAKIQEKPSPEFTHEVILLL